MHNIPNRVTAAICETFYAAVCHLLVFYSQHLTGSKKSRLENIIITTNTIINNNLLVCLHWTFPRRAEKSIMTKPSRGESRLKTQSVTHWVVKYDLLWWRLSHVHQFRHCRNEGKINDRVNLLPVRCSSRGRLKKQGFRSSREGSKVHITWIILTISGGNSAHFSSLCTLQRERPSC